MHSPLCGVMMRHHCHHSGLHSVMPGAARRFDDRCHPLQGERGDHQPKQECLEDTVHGINLAHSIDAGSLLFTEA